MVKKIKAIARDEHTMSVTEPPTPSIEVLPEWYKNISQFHLKNNIPRKPNGESNVTVKRCVPFRDSISAGYMLTLQTDVYAVDPKEYGHRLIWDVSWEVVGSHSNNQIHGMPIPASFEKDPWKWMYNWGIELPKGYSLFVTHPINYFDLPFQTMSGIVDCDTYHIPINLPFLLKKDFYGKIEKGTPIAQIIPFKRDDWKIENSGPKEDFTFVIDKLKSKIEHSYKNSFWKRKMYR